MLKEPLHGRLSVRVASSEEGLLAANGREAHAFQLTHGSGVELGQSRSCGQLFEGAELTILGGFIIKLELAALPTLASEVVELKGFWNVDRNFCSLLVKLDLTAYQAWSASS